MKLNIEQDDILLAMALFYKAYPDLPNDYFKLKGQPIPRQNLYKKFLTSSKSNTPDPTTQYEPTTGKPIRRGKPRSIEKSKDIISKMKIREEKETLGRWKLLAGIR